MGAEGKKEENDMDLLGKIVHSKEGRGHDFEGLKGFQPGPTSQTKLSDSTKS